jgi:hypothetical protein
MEAGSALDLLALAGESDALVGDFLFKFLNVGDVLVDDRLVDQRPEGFSRLRLCPSPSSQSAGNRIIPMFLMVF